MKYGITLLLTLLTLLTIAASAQTAGPFDQRTELPGLADAKLPGSVVGTILGPDPAALRDVRIELRTLATGRVVGTTFPLPNGSFQFNDIPRGQYVVVATSGLRQDSQEITVMDLQNNVTLRLPAANRAGSGQATVSVAQLKVPDKAVSEMDKAEKAFQKNKLNEAREHVNKALAIFPQYSRALAFQAILDLNDGKVEAGRDAAEKAVDLDRNSGFAHIVLGSVYNVLSRFDDALRALDRGLALSPSSWQGYFESAKALLGKGDFRQALRDADKAAQFAPRDYPPVHLIRAHAFLGLKDYSDASTELQNYLGKDPNGANSAAARRTLDQVRSFMAAEAK